MSVFKNRLAEFQKIEQSCLTGRYTLTLAQQWFYPRNAKLINIENDHCNIQQ